MVLPTLPSYLELKKINFNEQYLKQKNTNEYERNQKWSNTNKYFNEENIRARQYNAWTSEKSYNTSMNAYTRQVEDSIELKEEKRQKLQVRREKLKNQIQNENQLLENELKELRLNGLNNTNTLEILKSKANNLKQMREEDRKKLAEEKLYDHWRLNTPEIRQLESKQFENYVTDQWESQLTERKAINEREKQLDNEYVKYLENEREKAIKKDIELQKLKLNRELELKEILKRQMIELKEKEAEQDVLEREEYELMQEQNEMSKIEQQRKEMDKRSQNKEYGRQLLRQHAAKLRKRAKEIQEALEFDLNILKMLANIHEKQINIDENRREKAKADAEEMMRVLNEQLRLEKEREAEFDTMFQDEAAREWEKRNAEWERERLARERLMNEVLNERQNQIKEKFEIIRQKKFDSLQQREELLKDMEITQKLAQHEREKKALEKAEQKQQLENQLTERREKFQEENVEIVSEFEQEQIGQQVYKNFVEKEKEKQTQVKFEPKSFGRKKVVWN